LEKLAIILKHKRKHCEPGMVVYACNNNYIIFVGKSQQDPVAKISWVWWKMPVISTTW
jgi:hypothetical protein